MARTPTLRDVRQRRQEIAEAIADLQAEDSELEVAQRALERLSGRAEIAVRGEASISVVSKDTGTKATSQKPDNIPTVPEMIIASLEDAANRGLKGLEPRQMTDFINEKWWPEADINNIGPIAWRMWKRKELAKRNSRYSLPKDETPPADEGGVSSVTGEDEVASSNSPIESQGGFLSRLG